MRHLEIPVPSEMPDYVATLLAVLVGGLIAGFFSMWATKQAHDHALKRQARQEESAVKALLQALHDEIETLWDRYMNGVGVLLEALKDGQAFHYYYVAHQDYFTVYRENSTLLGKIKDADLRKALVKTYTQAKGLLDSYALHNHFLQEFERWTFLYQETKVQAHQQAANAQMQVLLGMVPKLKQSHAELKASVEDILRRLRKTGVLHDSG